MEGQLTFLKRWPDSPFSGGHQGGSFLPAFFVGSVFTAGGDRRRVGVSPGQGLHHIAQLLSQAGHGADTVSNVFDNERVENFRERIFLIFFQQQKKTFRHLHCLRQEWFNYSC